MKDTPIFCFTIALEQTIWSSLWLILLNWVPWKHYWSNIDPVQEDRNELIAEDFADDIIPRSFSFGTYLPTVKFLNRQAAIYSDNSALRKLNSPKKWLRNNCCCTFINISQDKGKFISFFFKRWEGFCKLINFLSLELI